MKNICFPVLFLFASIIARAQDDAAGCKDNPLLSRMPNTSISQCSTNYDQMEIALGDDSTIMKEGNRNYIQYMYHAESGAPAPSFFQIVKNYETALAKKGGKKTYYSKDAGVASFFLLNEGKEEWIVVNDLSGILEGSYELTSLEIDPLKQEVTVNSMYDELSTNGFVALYINFEKGKSEIKNESNKLIGKIAEMLLTDIDLNISIEGHTDEDGSPAKNQSLSEDRAKAVLDALAARGIDRTRMKSRGWGQTKPVAGNDSEEGRAKNSRIVIKKL